MIKKLCKEICHWIGAIILFPIVVPAIVFVLCLAVLAFYAQRHLERP